MSIAKDKLADMYEKMLLTRTFEETAAKLFTQGKVHGTAHFCIGEEATGIGVCAALEPQDQIYATHRGHGQSIGKGMDVKRMMAEFLGKATGVCRGKGGCMHIAELAVGNLGANGIVAGGIPIAVGSALSAQMQGIDRVVVDFFGDGAANEGSFHEALNLAAIWKLPILFVCVNNQYGMSMHVSRHMAIPDIAVRASSYGMPGKSIDGNDIFQVYAAALEAREYVRTQGPLLLVTNTYRIMGHSKSDANVYRTKEEVEEWRKRCPLKRMKERLLAERLFSAAELQDIETRAERTIREALEFAEASPEPALETATEDVYAEAACSEAEYAGEACS
ncbi:MAG: pyruvate dehydrogenase [Treponema sp. GWB1_62_6]|nr:MAG: pyruvate dehydrogenase [Treponema sp. GWB1_62_6]